MAIFVVARSLLCRDLANAQAGEEHLDAPYRSEAISIGDNSW